MVFSLNFPFWEIGLRMCRLAGLASGAYRSRWSLTTDLEAKNEMTISSWFGV